MIKQDYLIRMIQEIISLLVEALLYKKKIRRKDWDEYDHLACQILGTDTHTLCQTSADELIARHAAEADGMEKLELAAVSLLKMAGEVENGDLLLQSKLRQEGLSLLKYAQQHSGNYSLQRQMLISLVEKNS